MRLFQGKKEAEKILSDLKKKIKKEQCRPRLAVILVGEDPACKLYVKLKSKAARRVGIRVVLRKFSAGAGEKRIVEEIKALNQNKNIQGILVQLPLPKGYEVNKIIEIIDSEKDVDREVLTSAIYFAFKKGLRQTKKKKVIAVVNSEFFGKALEKFFSRKGVKINYLLRKNFSPSKIRAADAIITVCGCHKLIKGDMIKKGVVLVDAGIPADIDRESVKNKAGFLTPVPGGIGPLVVALLLKNVYNNCAYGNCKTY
jgi:methylenetetrahydrofolate dehydrogenase (NADP+)/methenyltetrahydrofolate cyclohydrolase